MALAPRMLALVGMVGVMSAGVRLWRRRRGRRNPSGLPGAELSEEERQEALSRMEESPGRDSEL